MKLKLDNIVRETDNKHKIEKLKAKGYKEVTEEVASDKPLSKMNKEELLAVAREAGIEVPEAATNKQIVELIEAARATND